MIGNDELPDAVRRGLQDLPSWTPNGFDAAIEQRATAKLVRRRRIAVAGSTALVVAVVGGGILAVNAATVGHGGSTDIGAAATASTSESNYTTKPKATAQSSTAAGNDAEAAASVAKAKAAKEAAASKAEASKAKSAKAAAATTAQKAGGDQKPELVADVPGSGGVIDLLPHGTAQLPDGLRYIREDRSADAATPPLREYLVPSEYAHGPRVSYVAGTVGNAVGVPAVDGAGDWLSLPGKLDATGQPLMQAAVTAADYGTAAKAGSAVSDALNPKGGRPFWAQSVTEKNLPGLTDHGVRVFAMTHPDPAGGIPALVAVKTVGHWVLSVDLTTTGLDRPEHTLTVLMDALSANFADSALAGK